MTPSSAVGAGGEAVASDAPGADRGDAGGLEARVDAIEDGYEFFLAYAAQGFGAADSGDLGAEVRDRLRRCDEALTGLVGAFRERLPPGEETEAALAVLERDARASLALIRLVASRDSVSSQLIDNLNASIHLRALLTDVFVLAELAGT